MFQPSDMNKILIAKVVFDESDDDSLDFDSEGNKKDLYKLSNKLIDKCNKLGLEIELFRNGIAFIYNYDNNKKDVDFQQFDENVFKLETYVSRKTGFRINILTKHISFNFVTGENISLAQKALFDYEQIKKGADMYFEGDNIKIFKNAYKQNNELLDDIGNTLKFIFKHI